jgi:hypothetical protein
MRSLRFVFALAILAVLVSVTRAPAADLNAASCSAADVQAAVNAAASRDRVLVPAGSCTYTSAVNIPDGKNITIQGAGINVTTISAGREVRVFTLNGSATRVTGFTFNQGQILIGGDDTAPVQDWRIDHNRFIGANINAYTSLLINCPFAVSPKGIFCRGVIDHNSFENGAQVLPWGWSPAALLHAAWSVPTNLGGADTVFIEDNTFSGPAGQTFQTVDTNDSGRFVFRFNSVASMSIQVHSLQSWRGSRAWEIYKNKVTGAGWTAGLIRGGVGVAWDNQYDSGWGPWVLDNVRSWDTEGRDYGACDGTSTADANTPGRQGYICRDQIGSGRDVCLSNPSTRTGSATGWCAQAHEPSYFWLNRTGASITPIDTSGRGLSTTTHVINDRDFYNEAPSFAGTSGVGSGPIANRPATCSQGVAYWATNEGSWNTTLPANTSGRLYTCTATNTWTVYYTPYTYPHPLLGATGNAPLPAPPAPSNLIVR